MGFFFVLKDFYSLFLILCEEFYLKMFIVNIKCVNNNEKNIDLLKFFL